MENVDRSVRGHGDGGEALDRDVTRQAGTSQALPAQTNKPTTTGTGDKNVTENQDSFKFDGSITLEDLRSRSMQFIRERNWDQFHSPRNVLLALVGEVGELAEIFQWKGEVTEGLPELSVSEREHVGQELSDVLLYLIDLSVRCKVDLPQAVLQKMAANAKKYPIDKSFGRSNKYTDYE